MIDLKVKIIGLDRMQRQLEDLSTKGIVEATRTTLNDLAYKSQTVWRATLRQKLEIRNNYTLSRVIYRKATGSNTKTMFSSVGHVAPYVRALEFGSPSKGLRAGKHVGVTTLEARGGNISRAVSRPNQLGGIGKLPTRPHGRTMKARNAFALRRAAKAGKKFVVLEGPNSRGVFKTTNKNMPGQKRGKRKSKMVRKFFDLSHTNVSRPRRPTLQMTLKKVLAMGPDIALRAMQTQLRLLGIK